MCRITGYKTIGNNSIAVNILEKMRDTLAHGGPDASNSFVDETDGIGFGHRRLSIIDLSDAGTQPMYYKHWVLVFNGEIYNYQEIRTKLETLGHVFSTGTDTEVLLKAMETWGYDAVKQFRGMFAFAIWDKKEKKLTLCRDRIGVKPLYFYKKGDVFLFASEIKAFHQYPEFDKTINQNAVSLFLQQGNIPSPHSIFKYVGKVNPGTFLEINQQNELKTIPYWAVEEIYRDSEISNLSEGETIEALEPILKESFKLRMVADVPVGMFLSGGIDSSLVTGMLQKTTNQQLKTFTIGFDDKRYDEAGHARQVAQHIGTDHTELICTENDFKQLVPKLPDLYDEPLGAGSAIPTYLVSKLAKEQVKVSLSADGGDEIFGGYTKYEIAKKYFAKLNKIPAPLRQLAATTLSTVSPSFVDNTLASLPGFKNYTNLGTKYLKLRNALPAESLLDFFNISSSFISKKELKKIFPVYQKRIELATQPKLNQHLGFLGMVDIKTFLEGEVMVKVDRASMRVALEGREPFLDQNIIEFGLKVPDNLKIKGNETKYLLRQILYKYVPKELIERPKQGFDIPMRDWTNGFLKEEILVMSIDIGFLDCFQFQKHAFRQLITDYFAGKSSIDPHFIWYLYVLFKWYNRWIKE